MGLLLWGIIEAPNRAWTSPAIIGAIAAAAVVLAAFGWWERHSTHPMLELSFFRSRRFSAAIGAMGLVIFALMGALFLLTQYLQFELGYSPLQTGLRIAPIAAVLLFAAPASTLAVRHVGTKPVVFAGLAAIAVGFVLLSRITVHGTYLDALPALFVIGTGVGLALAPCTESVMGSLPLSQLGVGSATNSTVLQTGGALGVGVFGSILNTRYADRLTRVLSAYKMPQSVRHVITGSLGGALAVAGRAGSVGAALARLARYAFVSGMDLAQLVGGIVVAGAAVLVFVVLPSRGASSAGERIAGDPEAPPGAPTIPARSIPSSSPTPGPACLHRVGVPGGTRSTPARRADRSPAPAAGLEAGARIVARGGVGLASGGRWLP